MWTWDAPEALGSVNIPWALAILPSRPLRSPAPHFPSPFRLPRRAGGWGEAMAGPGRRANARWVRGPVRPDPREAGPHPRARHLLALSTTPSPPPNLLPGPHLPGRRLEDAASHCACAGRGPAIREGRGLSLSGARGGRKQDLLSNRKEERRAT